LAALQGGLVKLLHGVPVHGCLLDGFRVVLAQEKNGLDDIIGFIFYFSCRRGFFLHHADCLQRSGNQLSLVFAWLQSSGRTYLALESVCRSARKLESTSKKNGLDLIAFILGNFTLTFFVAGLLASAIALWRARPPRSFAVIVEALFSYFVLFSIGFA